MTTTAFLHTAHYARLIDLLETAIQAGPVSVPECRLRITRTAILRELSRRGILTSSK